MGLVQVVLLVGCLALAWYALQPRYRFLIRIKSGRARLAQGKVTDAFLADVDDVCRDLDVASGWFGGVKAGRHVRLVFSRTLPPGCRQRLRNVWTMHG